MVLWVLQVGLAIKFLFNAGGHGLIRSREMREGMTRMGFMQAQPVLAVVSLLMGVGALGLVAPVLFPNVYGLVPAAAGLLTVLMMGSMTMHPGCRDKQRLWVSAIIFILCIVVGVGRLSLP